MRPLPPLWRLARLGDSDLILNFSPSPRSAARLNLSVRLRIGPGLLHGRSMDIGHAVHHLPVQLDVQRLSALKQCGTPLLGDPLCFVDQRFNCQPRLHGGVSCFVERVEIRPGVARPLLAGRGIVAGALHAH